MPVENEITVIEARDWIKNHSSIVSIDLRDKDRYEQLPSENFMNVPFDELTAELPRLNRRQTILLLCEDGRQSRKAQKTLKACSLKSFVIRGGVKDWERVINPKIKKNYPPFDKETEK